MSMLCVLCMYVEFALGWCVHGCESVGGNLSDRW